MRRTKKVCSPSELEDDHRDDGGWAMGGDRHGAMQLVWLIIWRPTGNNASSTHVGGAFSGRGIHGGSSSADGSVAFPEYTPPVGIATLAHLI